MIGLNGYYVSDSGWKNYDIQGYSSACAHADPWPTEGNPTSMLTISTEAAILNKNSQRPPSEDKGGGGEILDPLDSSIFPVSSRNHPSPLRCNSYSRFPYF